MDKNLFQNLPRSGIVIALSLLVAGVAALFLFGEDELTEEQKIVRVLEEATECLNQAEANDLLEYLSEDYSDSLRHDRRELERVLKGLFFRGDRFSVALHNITVEITGPEAKAQFEATGSHRQKGELVGSRTETYQTEVSLVQVDGEWKIRRVDFKRNPPLGGRR